MTATAKKSSHKINHVPCRPSSSSSVSDEIEETIVMSSVSNKQVGGPPTSPYFQIPTTQNLNPRANHSWSMSEPSCFLSFDSLPQLHMVFSEFTASDPIMPFIFLPKIWTILSYTRCYLQNLATISSA
ncbi:unnamed protein product [Eruca vesicaria subsp. sativa]|uniref:Uncharacterized protein n=1 Tax=Eruca vesicaria subsp. sativa TaxID=29727 RepID=A0ABC8LDV2_ERUVS|nr:unnamed protein product [Eruca vesicaria subsp. sativa]